MSSSVESDAQESGIFSADSGIAPIASLQVNHNASTSAQADETEPLLPPTKKVRKHWYRARPLWLVPFAVGVSIARGMTLAPRVEVFTELACERLRPIYFNHTAMEQYSASATSFYFMHLVPSPLLDDTERVPEAEDDLPELGSLPSKKCIQDRQVQAGAARIQAVMSTTSGLLSAITTGSWGRFGEHYGRTKVLALAISGLLFTDIMFVLASTKAVATILGGHRYALLLIAPVVEGLLGGYSTAQATTTSYLSDCTSDGSRANIFSRFHGVFFIGIAVGPAISALLIRYTQATTLVFIVSASISAINLVLCVLVLPESLTTARREELRRLRLAQPSRSYKRWFSYPMALVTPLAVFLPRKRENRKGLDWNFPFLAAAIFFYLLTVGMYQTKYLYAAGTYSWGAEQLSQYITLIGTARAFHLLVLLPYIIRSFKPTSTPDMRASPDYPRVLTEEMYFDIAIAKASLLMDVLSHTLVAVIDAANMEIFVVASMLTSLGGGALPSLQSLAVCVSQVHGDQTGNGVLFGAIGFLQAVGSMILGPLLFGLVFSATAVIFPKAIFVIAATLLSISIGLLTLMRPDRRLIWLLREQDEQNRGRPRHSKALTPQEP